MLIRPLALILALLTGPAAAERFEVVLGGRTMGTLETTASRLTMRLDNTPLGVGDGAFEARLSGSDYESLGRSAREARRIRVVLQGGTVRAVTVEPASEATDLSTPANVPAGVVDPVTAMARIVGASDCPAPFRLYDGRRAIEIATTGKTRTTDRLSCEFAYTVIAGPGHLSPFRFRNIAVTATYDVEAGRVTGAREIALSAGPFTVRLVR